MAEPLYQASNLHKQYGVADARVEALRGLDLAVFPGEFLAITGPSGSGKSTLLGILGLLARHSTGTLRYCGEDVSELSHTQLAAIRKTQLGFVFQSFQLLDRTTALENVALPLVYSEIPRKERHSRALAALERVGLSNRASHEPAQLSGGEQQRVAIARAIVNDPQVILADEPTGALDGQTGADILEILWELNREGTSIIVITHDTHVARGASRQLWLADGQLQQADRTATASAHAEID